ncbi:uncharacterized protein BJ212DRAFT_1303475 [Suillus subaureus]|uniref:Uncharacterized protein n=1 Tax=Suillus subaureus TaxID=48587 RepID=A0A9P7J7U9_9AGAM|nr:uncharacterized protein BJ212DRAFT_1303475 [Suillus subaureus]KAG1807521.1 hypothetical protein BJ212DRAFT_1303475 [Suillus subaureus]
MDLGGRGQDMQMVGDKDAKVRESALIVIGHPTTLRKLTKDCADAELTDSPESEEDQTNEDWESDLQPCEGNSERERCDDDGGEEVQEDVDDDQEDFEQDDNLEESSVNDPDDIPDDVPDEDNDHIRAASVHHYHHVPQTVYPSNSNFMSVQMAYVAAMAILQGTECKIILIAAPVPELTDPATPKSLEPADTAVPGGWTAASRLVPADTDTSKTCSSMLDPYVCGVSFILYGVRHP